MKLWYEWISLLPLINQKPASIIPRKKTDPSEATKENEIIWLRATPVTLIRHKLNLAPGEPEGFVCLRENVNMPVIDGGYSFTV